MIFGKQQGWNPNFLTHNPSSFGSASTSVSRRILHRSTVQASTIRSAVLLDPATSDPRDRYPVNLDLSPLSDLRVSDEATLARSSTSDEVDLEPGSTLRPRSSDLDPATTTATPRPSSRQPRALSNCSKVETTPRPQTKSTSTLAQSQIGDNAVLVC
ncbi:hypothetical protein CDL15_Pgr021014 [Punica granatum]|uniref:Uncharacterized protein n=1 Tax=Punica granatum TaxID=22663 RepID=A0A218Y1L0_PUNGR|nr:hypothetical protein CDL15_Pgr021014 [Punica granatum]